MVKGGDITMTKHLYRPALLFVIGALFFSGCSTSKGYNKYADQFFAQGDAWFKKGEYDRAIEDFTKVLKMAPGGAENSVVYYNRGLAYYKNREYERAILDFDRALELTPKGGKAESQAVTPKVEFELFNIYKARGDAWFYKGGYARAIDDYSVALKFGEQREELPSVYNGLGWAWLQRGEYERAIKDFSAALKIDSGLAQSYYGRGYAWWKRGDVYKALFNARKALKLEPGNRVYDDFVYELRSFEKEK
jgi:tetratricopeptide (TPR) repeat protein